MQETLLGNNPGYERVINTSKPIGIEQQFKELIYTSPIAIYTCDQNGYITFFNSAAAILWGREPKIGKDLWCGSWKIYFPNGKPMPLDTCPMARTLKEGKPFAGIEITIERPDHTLRNVLVYPRPIFDERGTITGAHNTLVDVTEQINGEKKQALLSAIVESSDDAIVSKSLDGIIASWNTGAEKIFGYTEQEAIGKHIGMLIPPLLQSEEETIISNIKSGKKIDHYQTVRLHKSGREIPVSITVSPVKDNLGNIIGASKIARDISERLQTERTIAELFEEVKLLSAKKDEFIALASHELKTPLTTIKALLQILEKNEKEGRSKLFLEKARNQAEKLNFLISDLFDVSKIEAGKLQLNRGTFDFRELVFDVVETFQLTCKTHEVIFNDNGQELIVDADKHRMEQVITNLLTNAVKYSPKADKVWIKLERSEADMICKIQDEGIGLSPDQQEQIFTRFYRAEGTSYISGLGLGLYLTKDIIDRHHGQIYVESVFNQGSEFSFAIPLKNKWILI